MRDVVARLLLSVVCSLPFWAPVAQARITEVQGVTHFQDTMSWGGRSRHALFFRPATTDTTTKRPLLVVLHYGGGNAEDMAALTQVALLVRDYNIWVALPEAIRGNWNNDPAEDSGIDDVGYINRLIDSAVSRFPVASKRIYLAGYSNGGFMAMRFACERPTRIAAAVTVSASFYKSMNNACQPAAGTPFAMINGTDDIRVNYNATYGLLTVPAAAKRWAQINGCPTAPAHSLLPDLAPRDKTRVEMDKWSSCTNGEVRLYTVDQGGHTWPDSDDNCALCGRTTYDIDGTLVVWNFVRRFSR
jgi:polyhydroxybutyrate depolymerase